MLQVVYCLASVVRSLAVPLLPQLSACPASGSSGGGRGSASGAPSLRKGLWEAFAGWGEEGFTSGGCCKKRGGHVSRTFSHNLRLGWAIMSHMERRIPSLYCAGRQTGEKTIKPWVGLEMFQPQKQMRTGSPQSTSTRQQ
jgi:hypothetical protein